MKEEVNKEAHDLVYALGWVVHDFNHLEYTLAACVALLVNPSDPRIGHIVTAGKAYSALVDLFGTLCQYKLQEHMNKSLANSINNLVKRLIEINELRNKLVHSRYLYVVEEKSFRRSKSSIKANKGLRQDKINVNSQEFFALSGNIHKVMYELGEFTKKELVPSVLAPIWINHDDDATVMWMGWLIIFSSDL